MENPNSIKFPGKADSADVVHIGDFYSHCYYVVSLLKDEGKKEITIDDFVAAFHELNRNYGSEKAWEKRAKELRLILNALYPVQEWKQPELFSRSAYEEPIGEVKIPANMYRGVYGLFPSDPE